MSNTVKVQFTKEQVKYLLKKTGASDAQEAVQLFMKIIKEEKVDVAKTQEYLNRLMDMDG